MNRAYYAAFSEASAYAQRWGFRQSPGGGSHQKMWNHVRSSVPDRDAHRQAERDALVATAHRLKERRQKADYRLNSRLAQDEDETAIREAERIIATLDRL